MNKKRLQRKVKKLQIRNRILRSDLLIEKENKIYEVCFLEAQIDKLTRDNIKWRDLFVELEKEANQSNMFADIQEAADVQEAGIRDIDEMIAAQERPTQKVLDDFSFMTEDPTPIPAPPIDDIEIRQAI